jgi:hemerythrin-like metal-binding protein
MAPRRAGRHDASIMPTVKPPSWTDALALEMPDIDPAPHEFVDLLGALDRTLAAGTETDVDAALARLRVHTEAHFAREERWIAQLGIGGDNAHTYQHQAVLNVLREAQRLYAAERDRELVWRLATGLAHWFPAHGEAMDRALSDALTERGHDPATGGLPNLASAPGAATSARSAAAASAALR